MRPLDRALGALAIALAASAAGALAPASADAQGNGRKLGHHKEKHAKRGGGGDGRYYRFDPREDRRYEGRRDGRYDRRDDRYEERRERRERREDRRERRIERRIPPGYRPVAAPRAGYRAVPPGHLPPPGLCRIWIDGVPPGRQPAPTSCAAAERYRPANARVIYGERARYGTRPGDRYPDDRYPDDRYPARYPGGAWPSMRDALSFRNGALTELVARLAPGAARVALAQSASGVPVGALFTDRGGRPVSRWDDRNGDGVVDLIRRYQDGRLVGSWTR